MAGPSIRPIEAGDLDRIESIERNVFPNPWSRDGLLHAITDHSFVLADDDRILGYLFGRVVADEAEILNLAVDPQVRRRGHAKRLIERFLENVRAAGARHVYLEVRSSNLAARRLYGELGFVEKGVRPEYYERPPEDALVMGLTLAPGTEWDVPV